MTRSVGRRHDPLRVLLLATRNQRRGAESFAYALDAGLRRRGLASRVLALSPSPHEPRLPVPVLGGRPLSMRTLQGLRRAMTGADVVVAHGSRTLPASVLAGTALRTRIIYQNIGDPMYWAASPSRRFRVRALLSRVDAVAALTEESLASLHRNFGVDRGRLHVIRNARDAELFVPATSAQRDVARARFQLPAEARILAIVGALASEKRVDLAINAVAARADDVHLLVLGAGPLRHELEALAAKRAPGRVTFAGQVDEPAAALAAADAVVLTSASEGVPGVLIEAGLMGKPVVSTDVGYVRDVIEDGVTGLVVAKDDPTTISNAIQWVLERADVLGGAAREHCRAKFDSQKIFDEWSQLVRSVAT